MRYRILCSLFLGLLLGGLSVTSYNYYDTSDSTWKPREEEVIQTWEILNESHELVSMLFKGYYRRK